MKIGILTNLYPPYARGGAERVARRIAHELHIRGHRVFVFSSQPYEGVKSLVARITERSVEAVYRHYPLNLYHGLNDHRFPFPVRSLWHLIDMYSASSAYEFGRVLDVEQPDIILSHNLKGIGYKTLREVRKREIPNIHTLHDVQLSIPSGLLIYGQEEMGLNGTFLRGWYERRMRRFVQSPDVVISPSRFLADFYQERKFFPKSEVKVIPNPVPHTPNVRRATEGTGPLKLLYIGQLESHKGVQFLLESLNKAGIDFRLEICGEGSLANFVKAWAKKDKRVNYHGFVPLLRINNLLSISDAVMVPSLCYENSPTVIYESFASGVPVIASNIGGVGELVKDGDNGYLFTPGDRDSFMEALLKFSQHRTKFWLRASQMRKYIEPYSIRHYTNRLEELINEVVSKR